MPPNPSHSSPQLVAAFRRFSAVAAALTLLVAVLVLGAWTVRASLSITLLAGLRSIQPLTAFGLLLGGLALWLLRPQPASAWQRRLGLICAGALAALGVLILLEYLLGVKLGLDQALFGPALAAQPAAHLGRPGPGTAGILLLVGLGLLALDPGVSRRLPRWLPPAGLALALVLASLVLLGYFYEETTIGQVESSLPVEPSSALAGALLALGVLAAQPEGPLVGTLTSTLAGGAVSRRLLPAAILLPFLLGWLRLIGLRRGFVDIGVGGALYAAGNIVVFSALVYWAAWQSNQAEARREAINLALRESEERLLADVAERTATEAALRQSEERFEKTFRASPAAVAVSHMEDGLFVDANDHFLQLLGYARDEVIGHTPLALNMYRNPSDRPMLVQRLRAKIKVHNLETTVLTKTGELRSVLFSMDEIQLGGQPHILTTMIDDTEHRRADEALHQLNAELEARVEQRTAELAANEAQLRTLFEAERRQAQELTLRDMMHTALAAELPLPEILRIVVEGIADMLGYTQVSLYLLEGDTLRLQHQVGYQTVIDSVPIATGVSGRVVRTGQPVLLEDVRTDPAFLGAIDDIKSEICVPLFDQEQAAGVLNLESTQGVRLTDADLRLMLALGKQVDFALGRARLAAQARESQQRFASAFSHATIGMALVSPAGRWLQVNPALCQLVGYAEAELLSMNFQNITHPDDLELDLVNLRRVLAGAIQSYQMEKRYFHKAGHIVWVLLSVSLVRDAQGQPLYFISQIQDINERKAAEQALAAQAQVLATERDLMQALMDSIPDTIYFKDLGSRFTRVNRAQAEYLRLPSPEAAIGRTDLELQEPVMAREVFDEEQRLVLQGQPLLNRIDLVSAPDGQPRWISSTKVPLRDKRGEVVGLVGISRDISALKQAEGRLLASLQEKDVLLKEIHHRVKNNLQVVSSLLRLQAETIEDPSLRDAFDDSQRRVRSMALVHEQLYRSADLAHIDFGEYITGLVNYLRRSHARPLHQLRVRVAVENVTLEIDRAIPLGLLVNELVTNSLKYAFPAGQEDAEIWVEASRDAAGTLTVVVGDSGVGLPDTVDLEQPNSMGWQLVQSFVTQLHAHYTLQRRPGAVFTLTIPERKTARG